MKQPESFPEGWRLDPCDGRIANVYVGNCRYMLHMSLLGDKITILDTTDADRPAEVGITFDGTAIVGKIQRYRERQMESEE